jgi:hypothetical protein
VSIAAPPIRPASTRMVFAAVALTVVGVALWVLYRVQAGTEAHAYSPGAIAPRTVQLTQGHTYHLSIPGGVQAEYDLGVAPSELACTFTPAGGQAGSLAVTAEDPGDPAGSKTTNEIASFFAPVTGRVHVSCSGLPQVFVDDADDSPFDLAGLWLVLATASLAIGLPMMISVLRRPSRARRSRSGWAMGEDEEIEGLVDQARRRADDREVADPDGGDVRP